MLLDEESEPWLSDRRCAGIEFIDLTCIDVNPDDAVSVDLMRSSAVMFERAPGTMNTWAFATGVPTVLRTIA